MDRTERLGLPLLNAGQLQREIWVNESLLVLDALASGLLASEILASPPADAAPLIWYRVDDDATGAWIGRDGDVATLTAGGWRFVTPFEGLTLRDVATRVEWRFSEGAWELGVGRVNELHVGGLRVVGPRGAAITAPAGGSVVDAEARTAIGAILGALRTHGLIG